MQNEVGKPEEVYLLAKTAMSFLKLILAENEIPVVTSEKHMLSLYLPCGVKDN